MAEHLLIDDTTVVTMNPAREVLDHAGVASAGERIVEVGAADAVETAVARGLRRVEQFEQPALAQAA